MSEYVLSLGAELDLDEIWEYIAHHSLDNADRWIDRLFKAFATIAETPQIGHTRPDLTKEAVLFWPVDAYLILYRLNRQDVEIVAITQGARNIPTFLHQRLGKL